MKRLKIAEDILSVDDLAERTREVLHELHVQNRPLIVTQNGKSVAVLLTAEEFDRLTYWERFLAAVHEGLMDFENARTLEEAELDRELEVAVGPLEAK